MVLSTVLVRYRVFTQKEHFGFNFTESVKEMK